MYCSRATTIGTEIMGKNVTAGAAPFKLTVEADGDEATVTFAGDDLTGYEYIFETASGVFEDGGCGGKRSTLNGGKIAGYKAGSEVRGAASSLDGAWETRYRRRSRSPTALSLIHI